MTAYYNEIDPYAAQWLENLIFMGHIAPGVVDRRSILDVRPSDLAGFTQCHFFAGLGGWSLALRLARWPDSKPVWTASCPCQPFSTAGQGLGFADERHLWPFFHFLTAQCLPSDIYGEQVASKDADPWIDLVQTDLEALGYAFGAIAFPSAGVGAPHIRDRTYWAAIRMADADGGAGRQGSADVRGWPVGSDAQPRPGFGRSGMPVGLGDDDDARLEGFGRGHQAEGGRHGAVRPVAAPGEFGGMADTNCGQQQRLPVLRGNECDGEDGRRAQSRGEFEPCGNFGGMADANGGVIGNRELQREQQHGFPTADGSTLRQAGRRAQTDAAGVGAKPGPTNGFWNAADWLGCRDGKWRPVEPGTFPLAHGAASRVGRLRAYGNAINPQQAKVFIESTM